MSANNRSEKRMTSMTQQSAEGVVADPDPLWRGLYRAGGVSAVLYLVLGVIVPAVLFLISHYDTSMNGAAILQYIASNKSWWVIVQTLTLGSSFLAIVVFVAIFVALKHLNKSFAAIGTVVTLRDLVCRGRLETLQIRQSLIILAVINYV